jgi:hypothetical protein
MNLSESELYVTEPDAYTQIETLHSNAIMRILETTLINIFFNVTRPPYLLIVPSSLTLTPHCSKTVEVGVDWIAEAIISTEK